MQVQAISNNQTSFNGVINVSENLAPKMKSFINKKIEGIDISKKPYDLFIKNTDDSRFLSIVAQSTEDCDKKYTVLIHKYMQKEQLIEQSIHDAMKNFQKLSSMPKKNFEKVI